MEAGFDLTAGSKKQAKFTKKEKKSQDKVYRKRCPRTSVAKGMVRTRMTEISASSSLEGQPITCSPEVPRSKSVPLRQNLEGEKGANNHMQSDLC